MGKKQQKSPVKPLKAGSATKPAKGKASVKKRPASATAVRDTAIDEAEQKRTRMQENLWALEKQVNALMYGCSTAGKGGNTRHSVALRDPHSTMSSAGVCVQIYDIETRYLTDANPRGNAVRGEQPCVLCCNCSAAQAEQSSHLLIHCSTHRSPP